jgi:hypothetical protein
MLPCAQQAFAGGYKAPAPKVMNIGQGMPGPLALSGPIPVGVFGGLEASQDAWAAQTVGAITNLSPSHDELTRFSTEADLAAGEALDDDTFQSPLQPTHAKTASVVFEMPITFSATGNQVTGLNLQCGGPVCVPSFASDGDTGVYTARPEICLPSSHHAKLDEVKDIHNNAIKCSTADGVQGNKGYWYDLAKPWSSVAYLTGPGPKPVAWNQTPNPNPVYKGKLSIPVDLPVPVNSIRIEFKVGLKDQPNPGPHTPYVKTYWGQVQHGAQVSPAGGPESVVTRFAVQLPNITVLPAAFVQMKVLPYTIVYRPPGDESVGSYATTQSYGTSMTTGNSTAIDNTTAFMESLGIQSNTTVNALIAQVSVQGGESSSNTNASDTNGTIGTGLVTSNSHSAARTWQLGSATTADPTILPASAYVVPNTCTASNYVSAHCAVDPAETYAQEPFWEDRIVLLLNPSAAFWNFKGGTQIQLLGAQEYDAVSIRDLYACSQNKGTSGWTLANKATLTPAECKNLLGLDPFYVEGQEYDPSQTHRGIKLGAGNYGADPRNPASASQSTAFQDIFTYQTAQSTDASSSYQTSVTSVVGFSWSAGITLGGNYSLEGLNAGITSGITVTQGYQNTTGTQMKISYTASTAATSTNATTISGTFSDDHDFDTPACQANSNACYSPYVNVYLDELFGSYMFSDPDAAPNLGSLIIHRSPRSPIKLPVSVKLN